MRCFGLQYRCIILRILQYFDELAGRIKIQRTRKNVQRYCTPNHPIRYIIYYIMLCYIMLHSVVWCCCVVLCCVVLCCAVLCCAVLCCAVLCCAVLCCAVLCCAVLCCAVLCCAVLCCAVLCCAVLCCAVLCCAPTRLMCDLITNLHKASKINNCKFGHMTVSHFSSHRLFHFWLCRWKVVRFYIIRFSVKLSSMYTKVEPKPKP